MLSLLKLIFWIFPGCFGLLWSPYKISTSNFFKNNEFQVLTFRAPTALECNKRPERYDKECRKDYKRIVKAIMKKNGRYGRLLSSITFTDVLNRPSDSQPPSLFYLCSVSFSGKELDTLTNKLSVFKILSVESTSSSSVHEDIICCKRELYGEDDNVRFKLLSYYAEEGEEMDSYLYTPNSEYEDERTYELDRKQFYKQKKIALKNIHKVLDEEVIRLNKEVA